MSNENAAHSTNPRTEASLNTASDHKPASRLCTRQDYVKREERQFRRRSPIGIVEEALVAEIIGASRRLRPRPAEAKPIEQLVCY